MESTITRKTTLAKNHGQKICNQWNRILVSCVIAFILSSCQIDEKPEIEWVHIPSGECFFGSNNSNDVCETPEIKIRIKSFKLSVTPITNKQFLHFIESTNYVTDAEKGKGSSYFSPANGWQIDIKRTWRNPQGINSNFQNLLNHPVVCISYNDAKAYCKWAKVRLPSEIEWEYACEFGKTDSIAINIDKIDARKTNYTDIFETTSPVKHFPANELGVYTMLGNVWELCEDNFKCDIHEFRRNKNSQNAYLRKSLIPINESSTVNHKVIKGGSFICCEEYCHGYRSNARQSVSENEAFFHIGFRVVKL